MSSATRIRNLSSGIAGGGDIILLPEIPYRAEDIIAAVMERKNCGKKFSIIVVAEGAKPEKGGMTVTRTVKGSPDPLRLGGVSYKIAEILEIPEGTVNSRMAEALARLSRMLEPKLASRAETGSQRSEVRKTNPAKNSSNASSPSAAAAGSRSSA